MVVKAIDESQGVVEGASKGVGVRKALGGFAFIAKDFLLKEAVVAVELRDEILSELVLGRRSTGHDGHAILSVVTFNEVRGRFTYMNKIWIIMKNI